MRAKAIGKLSLDPLQPSTFRYAALHSWIVARVAGEENLELFEHLDPDTTLPVLPAPHDTAATDTPAAPTATDTPAAPTATSVPAASAANEPPTAPAATDPPVATTAAVKTTTATAMTTTASTSTATISALPHLRSRAA